MPVEIKELVIRAVVDSTCDRPTTGAAGASGAAGTSSAAGAQSGGDQAALVAAAVKEVLRVLRTSKER